MAGSWMSKIEGLLRRLVLQCQAEPQVKHLVSPRARECASRRAALVLCGWARSCMAQRSACGAQPSEGGCVVVAAAVLHTAAAPCVGRSRLIGGTASSNEGLGQVDGAK